MTRRDLLEGAKLVGCIVAAVVIAAVCLVGIPYAVTAFIMWELHPAEWGGLGRAVLIAWSMLLLLIAGANS